MTWLSCFGVTRLDSATKRSGFDDDFSEITQMSNVNLYSYKELRAATNDFSPANKIGEGGFGSVYMGKLRGQMAGIKVLSTESRQGVREFLTEIKVISDVRHENLVELYGCCVEGNHRILVYNHLENGSLDRALLGKLALCTHKLRRGDSNIQFSWRTRVKICIGVGKGLAYLHEEVRPHVIHRDIKASNILLDKYLTPKISDFGLAKLIPPNMTHVSTRVASTRVAGTIGYLAPEYAIRSQLTRRADIYSFGVLLIEIVSGRCNTITKLPRNERYILEKTWLFFKRRELVELVDTSLDGDFDAEQACKYLKIGLLCTQNAPKRRPFMSTIVLMLTGEKDVDESTITEPGMLSDFMDMTIPKGNADKDFNTSSNFNSSGTDTLDNTMSVSEPSSSSQATMTFTSIYDRSR